MRLMSSQLKMPGCDIAECPCCFITVSLTNEVGCCVLQCTQQHVVQATIELESRQKFQQLHFSLSDQLGATG